ncbi:MAG: hypothetical protein Q8L27_03330 [archaeon]|nr:hypothetical protein [archaeon]
MNKKAETPTWLIVFLIIFIVIIVATIVIIILVGSSETKTELIKPATLSIFLTSSDSKSKSQVPANFMIFENGTLVSQGTTILDTPIEVIIPLNKSADIYCFNDEYYTNSIHKDFTNYDFSFNASRIDCQMDKIGKLKIETTGDLSQLENHITLGLTSTGGIIRKLNACISWSIGMISIDDSKNFLSCPYGNWTKANESNTFLCNSEKQKCSYTDGRFCMPYDLEIPYRIKNQVDKCSSYGWTLNENEKQNFLLDVDTFELKNSLDYVQITFFGEDKRYINNEWRYIYEYQGNPIGLNDTIWRIDYK